ncbi:MAG: M48 family metallopeptidase, partial [Pseudomonadota bacterium]
HLYQRDVTSGTMRRVATRGVLAVAAIGVMLFVVLPGLAGTLATLIPADREAQMGRVVVAQMERLFARSDTASLRCQNSEGEAALAAMLDRLGAPQEPPITLSVFDHEMVNAFAAPGGQVVLLRGLIEEAESPDEVAAVLAHEVAHVIARDPTRAMLRAAGSAGLLSLVFSDFAGGTAAVVLSEALLDASYSRGAEEAADEMAVSLLQKAEINTKGMADFFGRLAQSERFIDLPVFLSTHPDTVAREAQARRFSETQTQTRPALDDRQWQALRGICD